MRVLHVIPSLSLAHGGPSVAMPLIALSLVRAGVSVDVATTDDDGPGRRLKVPLGQRVAGGGFQPVLEPLTLNSQLSLRAVVALHAVGSPPGCMPPGQEAAPEAEPEATLNQPVTDGYGVFYFRKQMEFYKVSLPLRRWLAAHVADYDLVHVHALFSHASVSAARAARRRGVPYVIRPLGVLNRWGMENRRRLLKSLSFRFVEQPILRHAAAIHYTSEQERIEAETIGVTARPFVVPLGLDLAPLQSLPGPERFFQLWPQARQREVILFLSRLDPKKGLDLLIDAFAELKQRRARALLVIAGSGEEAFVRGLRARAEKLGVGGDVVWTGFRDGADKLAALSAAKVFVLPSYSENFGIAAVEAMAAGVPSVLTQGVGISEEVQRAEAGLVVPATATELAVALLRVLSEPELAQRLSANARKLAEEQYSLEAMGETLKGAYEQIKGERLKD